MRSALAILMLAACGDDAATTPDGALAPDAPADGTCHLADDTTATSTLAPSGCAVRDRDTSSCMAARMAAGLSGFWLEFSCRVTLTASGGVVTATSDDLPDYPSNYFAASDPCHEAYTGGIQNPNTIKTEHVVMGFPMTPSGNGANMMGAIVGMALNGVGIFGNFAAPGDDIYQEAKTFDRCDAHPAPTGQYHYHAEPWAISYDDDRFIGVMRDGVPIYGRRDTDGTIPTDLDVAGGHTKGTYHYHVNLQTSGTASEWFLTKGVYAKTPGTCTGCN